ncbi:YbdD/YjiX family protein [Pantoea sp. KPR_PJ]|uniref:YbdD/YjiX family protein n=1 Tax=Pantoea sp. KPR_PJ TaxID=2738375 RepID=UPI003526DB83
MSDAIRRVSRPASLGKIICCQQLAAPATGFSWRRLWRGLQQSFRLMVGVQDYQNYLQHMRHHHPDLAPMSEREFHRYCLDARFPSQAGKLGKCPC